MRYLPEILSANPVRSFAIDPLLTSMFLYLLTMGNIFFHPSMNSDNRYHYSRLTAGERIMTHVSPARSELLGVHNLVTSYLTFSIKSMSSTILSTIRCIDFFPLATDAFFGFPQTPPFQYLTLLATVSGLGIFGYSSGALPFTR